MFRFADPEAVMRRALELAAQGIGTVEPNPPVGAVVVDHDLHLLGEGWHQRCGGPHAEVFALESAGDLARGATLYVTLEPCAHFGRTPPCAPLVVERGIRRVVAAVQDPAPHTDGAGFRILREAGIGVEIGLLGDEARQLIAPFTKLMTRGLPYVHAKWAMTLDGRIATRTGSSRWISGEESRRAAHELRGRMDAVIVGIGTALADDPLLTPRPPGPRAATRIVVDSHARLPTSSQLAATAREQPVLVAVGSAAPDERCQSLRDVGIEILQLPVAPAAQRPQVDLAALLHELGRCRMTHVLVEGGSQLLGAFFDARLIDECHVFIAPKLVGGLEAPGPLGGLGTAEMAEAIGLDVVGTQILGTDIYLHGRVRSTRA